jgi:hypothetical protein
MRAVAVVALVGTTIVVSAHAGEPDAPANETGPVDSQARAEELIRRGVELRKQRREREALQSFREAHGIQPSPRVVAHMGLSAKSLRLYVEAERHLEAALASADPWVQQNRQTLELARDMVASHLASVVILGNVDGAELFVNGAIVGKLPLSRPLRVEAGTARIELRATGYEVAAAEQTLPGGRITEVRLALRPLARAPLAPVSRSRSAQVPADAANEGPALAPWIVAASGVAVVGLGMGAYFGARALSLKGERDETCPTPSGREAAASVGCSSQAGVELDDDARVAASVSTVGFVIGGVGLAAAGVLLGIELGSPRRSVAPSAAVSVDHTGATARASWRF